MRFLFARRSLVFAAAAALISVACSSTARAADFSFSGAFTSDDNVALFSFAVADGPVSLVTVRTSSYATGGFDPVLSVFRGNGLLLADNDDVNLGIPASVVPADPTTGQRSDSFLEIDLVPGVYTLALTQYDNFAAGPNLSNGFLRAGQNNFTGGPFVQSVQQPGGSFVNYQRTGNYAVQILNVQGANAIPEPGTLALAALGLPLLAGRIARRRRSA